MLPEELHCNYPFVETAGGCTPALGGSQAWYFSYTAQYSGCGAVAAAGLLAQLALTNPVYAAALGLTPPAGGHFSQAVYLPFQEEVYRTMGSRALPLLSNWANRRWQSAQSMEASKNPRLQARGKRMQTGVWANLPVALGHTAGSFCKGLLRYAGQKGLLLKPQRLNPAFSPYEPGLNFIRQGLALGLPVVVRSQFNAVPVQFCKLGFIAEGPPCQSRIPHFFTLVGLRRQNGQTQLLASNYGRPALLPYNQLHKSWQSPLALGSALLYFTPA